MTPLNFLLVFVGGGIGSVLRYLVSITALRLYGPHFPLGTLAVNVIGCATMGAIAAFVIWRGPGATGETVRIFFMTGILGGFTTFSAFALDTMVLWERGDVVLAGAYVLISVGVSLAVIAATMAGTRMLLVG